MQILPSKGGGRLPRFHLLHTNDLHSHLEMAHPLYRKIQGIRRQCIELEEELLLVDAGDHMDRACLETEGTDGQVNRRLLEQFAYDAITLGNNELLTFDKKQLIALYQQASFAVVSSNLIESKGMLRAPWCKRWKIFQRAGLSIGVLGVTVPFDHYYEQMGWQLDPPLAILERDVSILRPQVDILIVLSHVGYKFDRELARKISDIDIIVGAHTHHLYEKGEWQGNTLIVAAGKHGKHLGHVVMEIDENNQIIDKQAQCWTMNPDLIDSDIEAIIQQAHKKANQELKKTTITLTEPMTVDWNNESPFANLLADSLADWGGTGLALVNSGQLLSSLHGQISEKDIHQVCPHPINPVLLSLKGDAIRQSLEESLSPDFTEMEIRGFGFRGKCLGNLAVSGLEIRIDLCQPFLHRICEIRFQDEKMEDDKEYLVTTVDMFTFGVGYTRLQEGKLIRIFMPEFIRELLLAQFQKKNALQRCQNKRLYFLK